LRSRVDGDDRLLREILDPLDLLVGEWADKDPISSPSLSIGTVTTERIPPISTEAMRPGSLSA
jgi:hypothetical protein